MVLGNILLKTSTGLLTDQTSINLVNTTATTVNIGGAATAIAVGANSGTITIGNPTLVGTQTTQNVYNTTATTVNAFGAATTINLGSTTGLLSLNNANIWMPNATSIDGSQTTVSLLTQNATTVTAFTKATSLTIGATSGATLTVNPSTIVSASSTISVFNTTATAVNAFGAATQLTIGATTGTANIRNANLYLPNATTIYSGQTTLDIANVNVTTLNFGGAATALNLGASTGVTTIKNSSTHLGIVYANSATASTSTTTGALVVTGGIGASGNINAGNVLATQITGTLLTAAQPNVTSLGNLTSLSASGTIQTTGIIYANSGVTSENYDSGSIVVLGGIGTTGNVHIKSGAQLHVGSDLVATSFPNSVIQLNSSVGNYQQVVMQNISNGSSASSDYVAVADTGTDSANYIDMGINSSVYNDASFTITKALDGYLYVNGGNVAVGTQTSGKNIIFHTGGTLAANLRAQITDYGLSINTSTIATSITSGALVVNGGVGISSNIIVGNGAIINSSQSSDNFRVYGKFASSMIYADSNTGGVVIGGANVVIQGGTTLKVNGTDSMMLPVGTTGQRPGISGNVDVAGMLRYNSSLSTVEFYTGSSWQSTQGSFTVISSDQFTANGSANVFTLGDSTTTEGAIVSINGVVQSPTLAYAISGNVLTFTENPTDGDLIDVRRITTTSTVTSIQTGYSLFSVDSFQANISTGTSSSIQRINVDGGGNINLVNGSKITYTQTGVTVSTAATSVDSFDKTMYRAAKYIATFTNQGSTAWEVTELLLVHDGTSTYITEYGKKSTTGSNLATYTATITGQSVLLKCAGASGITNSVKVQATYIAI